jgi:hypothetical protein
MEVVCHEQGVFVSREQKDSQIQALEGHIGFLGHCQDLSKPERRILQTADVQV